MTTRDLMRELRLLGQADIPKDSLERVWMRVLRETGKARVPESNRAQRRAGACPADHSFPVTAPDGPCPVAGGAPEGVRS